MQMNGHQFIDILKIDIEGYEFSLLTDLIKAYKGKPLPFGQLQLEIHAWSKSFVEVLSFWRDLEEAGLRPFWTEPNLVYLNLYRGHAPDLSEVRRLSHRFLRQSLIIILLSCSTLSSTSRVTTLSSATRRFFAISHHYFIFYAIDLVFEALFIALDYTSQYTGCNARLWGDSFIGIR